MWLFIEPSDVWLFRDGRPFDAGADHRARSLFPPHPTTLQGAIRSKVLALYGVDLANYREGNVQDEVKEQIGVPSKIEEGNFGTLRLRGPLLARHAEGKVMPYFPCPADLLKAAQVVKLKPQLQPSFKANWPEDTLKPLVYDELTPPEETHAWLSAKTVTQYLAGATFNVCDLVEEDKLFHRESRFGVGIDSSVKRPQEGFLYQTEYIRPAAGVGLLVEVKNIDESRWGKQGSLSLGGESRAAHYQVVDPPASDAWPQPQADADRFKIYLATPTYFNAGWRASNWKDCFNNQTIDLIAAAVPRHQPIGGWDVAHNRQKPMRRYVPAGSVYYFQGAHSPSEIQTGDDKIDQQIGFGLSFTGRW